MTSLLVAWVPGSVAETWHPKASAKLFPHKFSFLGCTQEDRIRDWRNGLSHWSLLCFLFGCGAPYQTGRVQGQNLEANVIAVDLALGKLTTDAMQHIVLAGS